MNVWKSCGVIVSTASVMTQTHLIERYPLAGRRFWNLAVAPGGKRLYATNGFGNDTSMKDVETQNVIGSAGVGRHSWAGVAGS